ncbi:hypothetical protein [Clostridium tertium]
MPFINGLEMLSSFNNNENFESIILTSYGEFDYAKMAISIGVSDYY